MRKAKSLATDSESIDERSLAKPSSGEIVKHLRRCTINQRRFLKALNATRFDLASACELIGLKPSAHARWMRNDANFAKTRELLDRQSVHELAITAPSVIRRIDAVVQRAMQAEPVRDHKGNPTGFWTADHSAALKGLDLLGKHHALWRENDTREQAQGPSLTVIVQQNYAKGPESVAIESQTVAVQLAEPEQ